MFYWDTGLRDLDRSGCPRIRDHVSEGPGVISCISKQRLPVPSPSEGRELDEESERNLKTSIRAIDTVRINTAITRGYL